MHLPRIGLAVLLQIWRMCAWPRSKVQVLFHALVAPCRAAMLRSTDSATVSAGNPRVSSTI